MKKKYPDEKLESIYNRTKSWKNMLRKAYDLGKQDANCTKEEVEG